MDVRGTWTLWEYAKNPGGKAAMAEVTHHRAAVLKGKAPSPAPPKPTPPSPTPSRSKRLVIKHHPLLRGHKGTAPDLVLRWANINASGAVDVVVHFHGYSGHKADLRLQVHKETISGLDFGIVSRPILGILPRGSYAGDQPGRNSESYDFPALVKPGALAALIEDALARLGRETGQSVHRGRLILTAHSGGGAALLRALAHNDPDEIHLFDALYQSGAAVIDSGEEAHRTPACLPRSRVACPARVVSCGHEGKAWHAGAQRDRGTRPVPAADVECGLAPRAVLPGRHDSDRA